MSQVVVTFGMAPSTGRRGDAPIMRATGSRSEEITSSGTSQATTITANAADAVTVVNNGDETIWITFGTTPTAIAGNSAAFVVVPYTALSLGDLGAGMKCAVINDS